MNEQKLVIVFPRGQLDAKDKERLSKGGIIAVEADNPHEVCQLHLSEPLINTKITGDAIVCALLSALAESEKTTNIGLATDAGKACHKFVNKLNAAINKTESIK